jgi:hypothetical protein
MPAATAIVSTTPREADPPCPASGEPRSGCPAPPGPSLRSVITSGSGVPPIRSIDTPTAVGAFGPRTDHPRTSGRNQRHPAATAASNPDPTTTRTADALAGGARARTHASTADAAHEVTITRPAAVSAGMPRTNPATTPTAPSSSAPPARVPADASPASWRGASSASGRRGVVSATSSPRSSCRERRSSPSAVPTFSGSRLE